MENQTILSVREMQLSDIPLIIEYWSDSEPNFLVGMGVDLEKIPKSGKMVNYLTCQINSPIHHKESYALIWLANNQPIGHSNVNKIIFGQEPYMHLHIWTNTFRKKGMGAELVRQSLPYFFNNLGLKLLFCEPYALNPAPNRTLEKIGFEFEKEYKTIPGIINFEQRVKRWIMTKQSFHTLKWK